MVTTDMNPPQTTTWAYLRAEPQLWAGGYYDRAGIVWPDSDHGSPDEAAHRIHWLNVGTVPRLVGAELERWRAFHAGNTAKIQVLIGELCGVSHAEEQDRRTKARIVKEPQAVRAEVAAQEKQLAAAKAKPRRNDAAPAGRRATASAHSDAVKAPHGQENAVLERHRTTRGDIRVWVVGNGHQVAQAGLLFISILDLFDNRERGAA